MLKRPKFSKIANSRNWCLKSLPVGGMEYHTTGSECNFFFGLAACFTILKIKNEKFGKIGIKSWFRYTTVVFVL